MEKSYWAIAGETHHQIRAHRQDGKRFPLFCYVCLRRVPKPANLELTGCVSGLISPLQFVFLRYKGTQQYCTHTYATKNQSLRPTSGQMSNGHQIPRDANVKPAVGVGLQRENNTPCLLSCIATGSDHLAHSCYTSSLPSG